MYLFSVLVAALATLGATHGAAICPDSSLLSPCSCEQDSWAGALLSCQQLTAAELSTVLNGIQADFYYSLTVENSMLGGIDASVFGANTFQEVTIDSSGVTSIAVDTFVGSKATLVSLKVTNNPKLTSFAFESLEGFLALEYLYFSNNGLTEAAGIPSLPLLWTIHLDGNLLTELPIIPYLPDLSWLNLQNNLIVSLRASAFALQPKLNSLYLNNNRITAVPPGSLVTQSNIRTIDLSSNLIETVDPESFDVWPDTVVTFNNNQMHQLSEAAFASQLAIMYDGSGHFDLEGNPLNCDCTIAWIVRRQDLLMSVYNGVCANGAPLEQLTSGDLIGC